MTLADVEATFDKWLYMPDKTPLLATLGTIRGNALPGDPIWTLIVGGSGSLKSEILRSLSALPDVYPASTLTEASLLSGTSERERKKGAKGGLLREIGSNGVLVFKDFTSILSMHRDKRAEVLGALRESTTVNGRGTSAPMAD